MLRKRIILETLTVVLVLLTVDPNVLWAQLNYLDGRQQVGGEIGHMDTDGIDHIDYWSWDPDPDPAGPVPVALFSHSEGNGVLLNQTLTSSLETDHINVSGSAFAFAGWGSQPTGALDVHGGGGLLFDVTVSGVPAPTAVIINGQINIGIYSDSVNSNETFIDVKLSADDGSGKIPFFEEAVDGTGGDIAKSFALAKWMTPGTDYRFEVNSAAAVMADDAHTGAEREAFFSLEVSVVEGEPMLVVPAKESVLETARTVSFQMVPPVPFDDYEFWVRADDVANIYIRVPAKSVRYRHKQNDFSLKVPAEKFDLASHVGEEMHVTVMAIGVDDVHQVLIPCIGETSFWVEAK